MTFGEIIVVRHGQSTWNSEGRWAGQADPPLTDHGRRQAVELAERCRGAGIGAVAASDLSRARQTGLIVADTLELAPPAELPDLRERWSRTITGLTAEEIENSFPGALAAWRRGTSTDLPGDSEVFGAFAGSCTPRAASRRRPRLCRSCGGSCRSFPCTGGSHSNRHERLCGKCDRAPNNARC
jgi:probable phosphoglycerate mutase